MHRPFVGPLPRHSLLPKCSQTCFAPQPTPLSAFCISSFCLRVFNHAFFALLYYLTLCLWGPCRIFVFLYFCILRICILVFLILLCYGTICFEQKKTTLICSPHEKYESDKRWRWLRPHQGCFQNVTFHKVKIFLKNFICSRRNYRERIALVAKSRH